MNDLNDDPARRHGLGNKIAPSRFVAFVLLLVAVTAAASAWLSPVSAFIIGFDVAAATFLISILPLLRAHSVDEMRAHAAQNDANRALLLAIAVVVTLAILAAISVELAAKEAPNVPLVIATLSLAWLFGNSVFALHYAHIYYLDGSRGGLDFAGEPDTPDYGDFVYFAYTLGMTFQTSDTGVTTSALRRIVTLHSLAAFVFNIGVLSFSINVLGGNR